ncbi:nephronectin isoform X2 [Protopterus annectens]|uniref:nephronectin isoform X2 n=1 Tax=Protopterus annectens TaxID=7888 RepID=UPI001CFB683B|nr:nephronectin isoform X2 [Protopterus annectens]
MGFSIFINLALLSGLYLRVEGDFDLRWQRQLITSSGLCRYGSRIDCCWGWVRQSWGHCQPLCQPACKHGECVGPNKCKCHPGFTGKTCNQDEQVHTTPPVQRSDYILSHPRDRHMASVHSRDLNECGLKPRPCKHRCMNTFGSYKCYCLNGYMLMPDGSCGSALSCSMANCQYGCDVVKGEVRCRCPSPGLQLGPDGRTCVDVDECATGKAVCPMYRKCINTFGSYLCKCQDGFDLTNIAGKFQCIDVNECATGRHYCSNVAVCYNTIGSYKCKCKKGYRGNGVECKPIPKVMIDPHLPYPFFPKKNGKWNDSFINNKIPENGITKSPLPPRPPRPSKIIYTTKSTVKPTTKLTIKPTTLPIIKPTTRATIKTTTRPTTKPVVKSTPNPTDPPVVITTAIVTTRQMETTTREKSTVDNNIQNEVHRGDVFIPKKPGGSTGLTEIDIEIGEENEAGDDPAMLLHSCNFDYGLCEWTREREDDQQWETIADPAGGQYLTVSEVKETHKPGARLILPVDKSVISEGMCLSFRHLVSGRHSGNLHLFIRRNGVHGPALWGRNSGHGWRHTQITLHGLDIERVIFKGERGKERTGEIGLDDISLKRGRCLEGL